MLHSKSIMAGPIAFMFFGLCFLGLGYSLVLSTTFALVGGISGTLIGLWWGITVEPQSPKIANQKPDQTKNTARSEKLIKPDTISTYNTYYHQRRQRKSVSLLDWILMSNWRPK